MHEELEVEINIISDSLKKLHYSSERKCILLMEPAITQTPKSELFGYDSRNQGKSSVGLTFVNL